MALDPGAYKKLNMTKRDLSYHEKFVVGKTIINIPLEYLVKAGPELNPYELLPENKEKLLEMKMSIENNGLFNPILVLKEEGSKNFTILSGHTRHRLYKELEYEYRVEHKLVGEANPFTAIPAIIHENISLEEAEEIVLDSNYLQRDPKDQKRIYPRIIERRARIIENQKTRSGKTIDIVAKEMNIGRTSVYENVVLVRKVIDELASYYYEGLITKKNIIKFGHYSKQIQRKVYADYKHNLSNKKLSQLKKGLTDEELLKFMSKALDVDPFKKISVKIPIEKEQDFMEMFETWLASNTA